MKAYKGFDKDLKCRGFQYEIGGEYSGPKPKACEVGFHACEMPLDVLNYYPPSSSRYCVVEQSGDTDKDGSDSKVASERIKINAEIGIPGLVKAQLEWVKDKIGFGDAIKRADNSPDEHATGGSGAASATGGRGAASATGDSGAASATGTCGAASATGDSGAASATGTCGAASATGDRGAASATGTCGAASATGTCGAASATGYSGAASATGTCGAASATGTCGAASATETCGAASATGTCGAASATGDRGAASATGIGCVALACGYESKALGALGNAIVCCERGPWNGETYPLIAIKAAIVDGETIKAGIWYTLKNGEFVEVE